jgi:hypothetical protein
MEQDHEKIESISLNIPEQIDIESDDSSTYNMHCIKEFLIQCICLPFNICLCCYCICVHKIHKRQFLLGY